MPPRRRRLRAGNTLPAADRLLGEVPAGGALTDAAPAPAPPTALAQPRLLQLPDDLILEVGLQLDHLGDLHTLLRRTCKRLRAITEAPCGGGGAGGSAAGDGCSRSGSPDGQDRGGSDASSGGGSGGQQRQHLALGGQQQAAPAPWPSAAGRVQAAWLLKWRGGIEPHKLVNAPADRGDGDVTLSLLGQVAASPGQCGCLAAAVFGALMSVSRHGASPQHERILEAVFRSHGAAVADLGPALQTCLLQQGSTHGSLTLVRAMLGLGAGTAPLDPICRGAIQTSVAAAFSELLEGRLEVHCAELTVCDMVVLTAAERYFGGVLTALLDAQHEGRVALAPLSVVLAWFRSTGARSGTQRQRGHLLAAPLARLTGMLRGSVRAVVSSRSVPSAALMELLALQLLRVAASGNVEHLEGLLGVLPLLPLERRACVALLAAHHGRAEAVSVLLAASPPHDPSGPWGANSTAPAALPPTSLGDVLRVAAVRGFTEAALAVLGAAGGAQGVCALVGSSRALVEAAAAGHASTVRALVARAGAGLGHQPLLAAAGAAREAGHTRLAGMLDRAAASARGRVEAEGS